jgi:hypothetical protein
LDVTAGTFIVADLKNFGTVDVNGGVFHVTAAVEGTGTATIGQSGPSLAVLEIGAADAQMVTFSGPGTLQLDHPSTFTGLVQGPSGGLGISQIIDLIGFNAASTSGTTQGAYDSSNNTSILTVTDSSQNLTVQLHLAGDYSSSTWKIADDGHGGTNIWDPPAGSEASTAPMQSATNAGPTLQGFSFDQLGNETFIFQPGFGQATISSFANAGGVSDKVELDNFVGISSFDDLKPLMEATNGGHDTTIHIDAADTVVLTNVSPNILHSSEFIIHHL